MYNLPKEQIENIDSKFHDYHLYTKKLKTFGFCSFFKDETFNMLSVSFEEEKNKILFNKNKFDLETGEIDDTRSDKFENSKLIFFLENLKPKTNFIDVKNINLLNLNNKDTLVYSINTPVNIFQDKVKVINWDFKSDNTKRFLIIYPIFKGYNIVFLELYNRNSIFDSLISKSKPDVVDL